MRSGSGTRSDSEGDLYLRSSSCGGCGNEFPPRALDDNDWCVDCQPIMRRRVRRGRHLIATLITIPFAIWILTLERGGTLAQGVWLLPLAASYYLGLRIGREVVRGWLRWRGAASKP